MYQKYKEFFKEYILITNEIDKLSDQLTSLHHKHMLCKNGCSFCCMDFSVFPVEFYFILNELKNENIESDKREDLSTEVCAFLRNHSCTIYRQRPIMCRTHGLPLLYANDDGDYELSACELNFTNFDFEDFTMENTMPQDKYNSKLFVLNKEFIADFSDIKYGEMDLIPMKELSKQLFNNEKQIP